MRYGVLGSIITGALVCLSGQAQDDPAKEQVEQAMMKATRFMVEQVSNDGGYVWNYLPDFSRSWGEMEALPGMIWFQPPGTPSMGQIFLDAYHATGDEYYYRAAEQTARAIVRGQLDCGGWNYMTHSGGEDSLEHWYETIGRNGWRLEEFRHYFGNATFDDDATYAPASFLLRLYLEKKDTEYLPPLQKAIDFVLESQYPVGGWPQRFPLPEEYPDVLRGDYSSYITLNDGVHRNNVNFLLDCHAAFGDETLLEPSERAMKCILKLHQPNPQPGWSMQHTLDLKPAGARTYEPEALYPRAAYACVEDLMDYYEYSGDRVYLSRVPDAIAYIQRLALPEEVAALYPRTLGPGEKVFPSFVELGTNKPLYVHRRGSNSVSGEFYASYDPEGQWMPTFSMRALNPGLLWARFSKLMVTEEVEKPLRDPAPVCFFRSSKQIEDERVKSLLGELEKRPYWEGIFAGSQPCAGDPPGEPLPGDYCSTQVGDRYDTSPYRGGESVKGICTSVYIENMSLLIGWLESVRDGSPDR